MADSRPFVARHARFKVPCCDAPIIEGDLVQYRNDELIHADHDNLHAHVERPEPAPCDVCWLTHPEGACDR